MFFEAALGRNMQYIDDPENIAYTDSKELFHIETYFRLKNYDITAFCDGHLH